jgi:hypothetical protein
MFVPMIGGKPLYPIPEGYSESGSDAAPAAKEQPTTINRLTGGGSMDNSAEENVKFVEENKSPLAGSPKDWAVDDFINFGENRGSLANRAVEGMIGMLPMGKVAIGARNKFLDREAGQLMDQMIETKLDAQGNAIPEAELAMLSKTRQDMINQMGSQTGLNLGPFDKIADAIQSVMRFTSSAGTTVGEPRGSATSGLGDGASEGYSYSGGSQKMGSNVPTNSSDSQYSGSTFGGAGDADGSTSDSAEDNAQSGTGGLYSKGGYITRKKMKKC